ncbi:hypothetical protein F5Y14DRAFT_95244 [Nemania sp. NC0429]|nr:hypothetical protein F5Y14DRAFT_95244 [Nemania sp. NC0429]
MTTSKPASPEAAELSDHVSNQVSSQAADRDSPSPSPKTDDGEAQHDNGHDIAQSPPSPSSNKPAQAPSSSAKPNTSRASSENPENPENLTAAPATDASDAPPLPDEPLPDKLPSAAQDDGWECHWDAAHQAWFFHNSITNESTWDNPRVPSQPQASAYANAQLQTPPATAVPPLNEQLPAGGYNPAIHGDYDPNAWYAKGGQEGDETEAPVMDTAAAYAAIGSFNRFTGGWQGDDQNPDRHTDEAKSRRQMNAFFDVDAAANAHDGRSLKAERSGKKPTKSELKHFKEKRRAKKEEKRRAWLRD